MPLNVKDAARLWDMLDAARSIITFTADLTYEQFYSDRKTRNAVERNLEIIGEAARHVSDETRVCFSEIPWKSMTGLRNVLAHEYGSIRHEILWSVIQEKLAPLIQSIEAIGADNPPDLND